MPIKKNHRGTSFKRLLKETMAHDVSENSGTFSHIGDKQIQDLAVDDIDNSQKDIKRQIATQNTQGSERKS